MIARILILHRGDCYRTGLLTCLQSESDYEVLCPLDNVADALQSIELHAPEIIIVCSNMVYNEAAAWQLLARQHPSVIILMEKADSKLLHVAMDEGVLGAMLKSAAHTEVINVINNVRSQMIGLCRTLTPLAKRKGETPVVWKEEEISLVILICRDLTNEDIGKLMHKSPHTIAKLRGKVKKKCGAKSTAGLMRFAISQGWIKMLLLLLLNGQVSDVSEGMSCYL